LGQVGGPEIALIASVVGSEADRAFEGRYRVGDATHDQVGRAKVAQPIRIVAIERGRALEIGQRLARLADGQQAHGDRGLGLGVPRHQLRRALERASRLLGLALN
jgi:hypothetical protein